MVDAAKEFYNKDAYMDEDRVYYNKSTSFDFLFKVGKYFNVHEFQA